MPLPRRALLSFVSRKRVTRERDLRGEFATLSSPLKNPLFCGTRTLRIVPHIDNNKHYTYSRIISVRIFLIILFSRREI